MARNKPAKSSNSKSSGAKNDGAKEVRIVFDQKGTSGLSVFGGFVTEAYNSVLNYPAAEQIYTRLLRSMPEIVMVRSAFTSWSRSVKITVELPDEPSEDDKKYADFVESVFTDVEGGQSQFIEGIVTSVPFYGWGWWEAVPGKREEGWKNPDPLSKWKSEYNDGLVGFRKIAYRHPRTFYGWDIDERKKVILGMKQLDYPNSQITLPIEESLHLTYGDSNSPHGGTPLEAVWRLERIRYGLEVVQGIGYEHSAGYLSVSKTEEGSLSEDDKSMVKSAARAILTAQEGNYALWPFGMNGKVEDVGFASSGNLLSAIQHYSMLVLSVYTMQWMSMSTLSGAGSYAAMNDSSTMGVYTYNAMLDGFAAQIDEQLGKRLWEWNKDSFKGVTSRPKIKITHIDKDVAITEISGFISSLNNIMPLGEEDWKVVRRKSGFLPKTLPSKEDVQAQKEILGTQTPDMGGAGAGGVGPSAGADQSSGGDGSGDANGFYSFSSEEEADLISNIRNALTELSSYDEDKE